MGDVPRFFFHIEDGALLLDEEGMEFADVNSAREDAIRACGEMIREVPETARTGGVWRLWVTDQPEGLGNKVLTLTVVVENG